MSNRFRLSSLLLSVHPLQGLIEAYLVGLLILALTSHLEGLVDPFVVQTAMFFLCGSCGMWAVLRIRLPEQNWFWRTVFDGLTGCLLGLVMLIGIRQTGNLFHWDAIWRLTTWTEDQINVVLGFTSVGYFFARVFVRLWLRWNAMRKKRMLWSITNAHLMVAIAFALFFIVLFFLVTPYSSTASRIMQETRDPMASVATSLLVTFFPVASLIVIGLVATLCVILPPSAVFSYFVSKRITRRLESLTVTTASLRAGDYSARVTVDGEDEIARLQSDFNAMADRLSTTLRDLNTEKNNTAQILQSRRDLIASVSHELRTPVATLRAAIETMLDRWDVTPPEENRRKVALMESEIRQLSGLIDDLFTVSQSDVDNLSLECVPTDLPPLINQVVDGFSPLAWQSGRVEVTAQVAETLPPVIVDPRRMQQVLLNLLRNGARHTPPGGIVVVSAEQAGGVMRIDVRDTGEGISPDDLGHIFERFYRGSNATQENAGLGLALVKELVEAMGGWINVESKPGEGSCFSLNQPLAK
jgi:signal transduction histidine kinase